MQKKKWVRVGLAVALVGGSFAASAATGCSGDDTSGGTADSGAKNDSSMSSSSSGSSSGASSGSSSGSGGDSSGSSSGGDSGPKPPNAVVYLVHAASDPLTKPLRFCFGLNPSGDAGGATVAGGIDPFPDTVTVPGAPFAGLYPGFGGSTASSPTLAAFDLSTLTIALYALDATQIGNDTADGGPDGGKEVPCEGLIGVDGLGTASTLTTGKGTLTMGSQYWYLGTIKAGTLAHGTTWIAAVTGCFPGEGAAAPAICPASPPYGANGNLTLTPFQLDNTTAVGDGGIGVQFANAAPAWDNANTGVNGPGGTTAGGVWVATTTIPDAGGNGEGGGDGGGDGGGGGGGPVTTLSLVPVGVATYGNITKNLVTAPVPLDSTTAGIFSAWVGSDGGTTAPYPPGCTPGSPTTPCASPLLLPLPTIDALTNGTVPTGGSFADGKGYAFILIGNPAAPTYLNPFDGGPATSGTGVYNGASLHFLGFPTAN